MPCTSHHAQMLVAIKMLFDSLPRSFITICRAHYVENVESEALEAVARWSVIGTKVSF